jgi:thioesterase domain-containing protein
MFDTGNPAMTWRRYSLLERLKVFWSANRDFELLSRIGLVFSRILQGMATNVRVRFEERAAGNAGFCAPYSRLRMLQVRMLHEVAMNSYKPTPINASMVLFKTEEVDDKFEVGPDYGWSHLVGNLKVVDVPGQHLTMFDSENVESLAKQMDGLL